jgi:hypothetical protein
MDKDGRVKCRLARKCDVPAGPEPGQCPHKEKHFPIELGRRLHRSCRESEALCCSNKELPELSCR